MTDIRGQQSEVSSQESEGDVMREDAGCGALSIRATCRGCETISDLRLLISGLCPLLFALSLLCAMLFALCLPAAAQEPAGKISRIGFLSRELHPSDSRAVAPHRLEAFHRGLRALGYIEGKNLVIEYRYADARPELLPALAEELVRLKVDIIVTDTAAPARAARKATSTIPIVMVSAGNPIQAGLVASLARPGGNVTGLTGLISELHGKRVELLKEVVPKVTRFAFLDDDDRVEQSPFKYAQEAAQALAVRLDRVELKSANPDFDGAFRMIAKERVGAVMTTAGFLGTTLHRKRILELIEQARIPADPP